MTKPITPEELAAMESREQAATEGPWEYWDLEDTSLFGRELRPASEAIGEAYWPDVGNAPFIAHARTDMPLLIAEVRRLWKEGARLRDDLREEESRHQGTLSLVDGADEAFAKVMDERDQLKDTIRHLKGVDYSIKASTHAEFSSDSTTIDVFDCNGVYIGDLSVDDEEDELGIREQELIDVRVMLRNLEAPWVAKLAELKKDIESLERFRDLRTRHNEEMERRTKECMSLQVENERMRNQLEVSVAESVVSDALLSDAKGALKQLEAARKLGEERRKAAKRGPTNIKPKIAEEQVIRQHELDLFRRRQETCIHKKTTYFEGSAYDPKGDYCDYCESGPLQVLSIPEATAHEEEDKES